MDLCVASGDVIRSTFSRSNMMPVPQLYKSMRKTSWGGMFPIGAGDEDYMSLLTRRTKKSMSGMSARERKRIELEEEENIMLREKQKKTSSPDETNVKVLPRSQLSSALLKQPHSGIGNNFSITSEDIPRHSAYLRSQEFLMKDKMALLEKEKAMQKQWEKETKKKSISKLGEAFRKRQAARRQLEEDGVCAESHEGESGPLKDTP